MAAVIQCDRCGKTGDPTKYICINAHIHMTATSYNRNIKRSFDICRGCYSEFVSFMIEGNEQEDEEE